MKRLFTTLFSILVIGIGAAGAWLYWPSSSEPSAVLDDSALGPCNRDRYLEYFRQAGDIAPISTSTAPNMADPAIQARIVDAFEAYTFEPDTTYFVSAHSGTGEIFPFACAEERCTNVEFFEPDQMCLRKHNGNCGYIAVVFENETYCTIEPTG